MRDHPALRPPSDGGESIMKQIRAKDSGSAVLPPANGRESNNGMGIRLIPLPWRGGSRRLTGWWFDEGAKR